MPKRFAKRRSSGGKRKVVRGRRRLSSAGIGMAMPSSGFYRTPEYARATARPSTPRKKRRSRKNATAGGSSYGQRVRNAFRPTAPIEGKNTIPAIRRSNVGRSGRVKQGIKRKIMDALVYGSNPVLKSDIKRIPAQIDWPSGQQGVATYYISNSCLDVEQKLQKMRDASYFNAAVALPTTGTDVTSQRMVVFPATFIANLKNTCSHTIYVDVRLYRAKGYHTTTLSTAWNEAMANDNVVQNPNTAPYPTEETQLSLYKRPDMRLAHLNCRYTELQAKRGKWVLEPGQETKFILKLPGFTFDQARYNVLVAGTDPLYWPQTYAMAMFCHSEMVTGAIDTDVCPGSGHLAINFQNIEAWQALPLVKKYQNIASYGWGDIAEADEQDVNTDDVQQEAYFDNT